MNTSSDDSSDEFSEPICNGEGGEDTALVSEKWILALNFVNEVRDNLSKDDVKKYRQFLLLVRHGAKRKIGMTKFLAEAKEIFKGYDNLFLGLNQFMPTVREPILDDQSQLKKLLTREDRAVFIERLKKCFQHDLHVSTSVINVLCDWVEGNKCIDEAYQEAAVLLQNNPDLLPELRRLLSDTPVTPSTRNEERFDLNKLPQMEDDHLDPLPGFRRSLPDTSVTPSSLNKPWFDLNALPQMDNDEFIFLDNVKERLYNTNDYDKLMEYLYHYSSEIFTTSELKSLVDALLGKHPDLMDCFNEFLDCCEKIDGYLAGLMIKMEEAKGAQNIDKQKNNHTEGSSEYLNPSNSERCTPSYRLLANDYPILPASYKSELDAEVLNVRCMLSQTSGSEGHYAKNPYEEILHICESHRFEMDMFMEYMGSTINRVQEFLDKLNDNTINSQSQVRVEDYFTVHNISCIKRLYGKWGMDIMDILSVYPVASSRVILNRLKQKQEKWTGFHADLSKVWAEVYAKNHEKSLDHRSLSFMKQDTLNLRKKILLAEIKENHESRLNEDACILEKFSGKSRHFILNLKYENSDNGVHEDLYKLILYSCKKVCSTKDEFNEVTKLWTMFIEPMLGVPYRHYCKPTASNFGNAAPSLKGSAVMKCSLLGAKVNGSKQNGIFAIQNDMPNEKHKEDVEHCEFNRTVENVGEADGLVGHECSKLGAKPLAMHLPLLMTDKRKKDSRVFYGNAHFYVLFRLHQILYERILSAKMNCTAAQKKKSTSKGTSSINLYARFTKALYSWLGGSINDEEFKDACRALMGNQSYNLFTLNKLLYKLSKQLATVATDEKDRGLLKLFKYENSRRSEKYNDTVYRYNAHLLLQKKNTYQFEFLSFPSRLTIKLMDAECQIQTEVSADPHFAYLNDDYLVVHSSEKVPAGLMLRRNIRKYTKPDELSASIMAMKDVKIVNNLEYILASKTSKITFLMGTEDLLYRKRKKRTLNIKYRTKRINLPVYTFNSYHDQS